MYPADAVRRVNVPHAPVAQAIAEETQAEKRYRKAPEGAEKARRCKAD